MQVSGAAAKQGQGRGSEERDISAGTQGCSRVRSYVQVSPKQGGLGCPSLPHCAAWHSQKPSISSRRWHRFGLTEHL